MRSEAEKVLHWPSWGAAADAGAHAFRVCALQNVGVPRSGFVDGFRFGLVLIPQGVPGFFLSFPLPQPTHLLVLGRQYQAGVSAFVDLGIEWEDANCFSEVFIHPL